MFYYIFRTYVRLGILGEEELKQWLVNKGTKMKYRGTFSQQGYSYQKQLQEEFLIYVATKLLQLYRESTHDMSVIQTLWHSLHLSCYVTPC